MKLNKVLKLGHPKLYKISEPVEYSEVQALQPAIQDLHDILMEFRSIYQAGRAIAAPQIGVMKRLVYLNIDQAVPMFNPVLSNFSVEQYEIWDDCLSFPDLLVKVKRHKTCTITFRDEHWKEHIWKLDGDLSELLQHECDHLDGILATQRAVSTTAFKWRTSTDRRF